MVESCSTSTAEGRLRLGKRAAIAMRTATSHFRTALSCRPSSTPIRSSDSVARMGVPSATESCKCPIQWRGLVIMSLARSIIAANGPASMLAVADSMPGCGRVGAIDSASSTVLRIR